MNILTGEIKEIKIESLGSLRMFLDHAGNSLEKFRYFEKRPLEVIREHRVTLLYYEKGDQIPCAYGHLDEEAGKIWLGLCVAERSRGRGIGKILLDFLLKKAHKVAIKSVHLSVDSDNEPAIGLYQKYGFQPYERKGNVVFMNFVLDEGIC